MTTLPLCLSMGLVAVAVTSTSGSSCSSGGRSGACAVEAEDVGLLQSRVVDPSKAAAVLDLTEGGTGHGFLPDACKVGGKCFHTLPPSTYGFKAQCGEWYTNYFGFPHDAQVNAGGQAVALVGDSITAGSFAADPSGTYPARLSSAMGGRYSVTNLGWVGTSLASSPGCFPYTSYSTYEVLLHANWDVVVVMLGTNDAKAGCWQDDCGSPASPTLEGCSFARAYAELVQSLKAVGRTPAGPRIILSAPPPLMKDGASNANATVVNSILPKLVPLIAHSLGVEFIDVYAGLGGVNLWQAVPAFQVGCPCKGHVSDQDVHYEGCGWFCDEQHCDQTHPNSAGYARLASIIGNKILRRT